VARPAPVEVVLDVAHNPSGARFLNASLQQLTGERRYVAVVGMLADKDAAGVAAALAGRVRAWVCVATAGSRGLSGAALHARLGVDGVVVEDPAEGLRHALSPTSGPDGSKESDLQSTPRPEPCRSQWSCGWPTSTR
jgi:folylpolyglutamate synthase/dihydropteroate synthase